MINDRQRELLKLIVEEYIKDARPVGSKIISEAMNCSSATIRNEMSYLEEIGLLEKTHTSSGRVPSEKGYRYYVDNIMEPKKLTGDDVLKLQTIFRNNSLVLSDTIVKSMEIVSELTNYTMVVLGPDSSTNKVSKIEIVPIDDERLVALIITDTGHVEHKNMILNEKISMSEIRQTVDIINRFIVGTPIDEVSRKLEFEIKPIITQAIKQHEVIYNAFYNVFSDFTTDTNIKMMGTKNMLMQPEFDDTARIRSIISKFEDKEIIKNIKEEDSGINIYIGSETEFDDDVTIIKTKYVANGEEGTLAIIGPKRMEYDRATSLLEFIKENIEEKR